MRKLDAKPVEIFDEKVDVLEVRQDAEIRQHTNQHQQLLRSLVFRLSDTRSAVVVDYGHCEQKTKGAVVPSGIEKARTQCQKMQLSLVADGQSQKR